ncbi:MAG: hypothetical protein Ct9H300mP15_25200 [Gemmatimonadota bacterium]|nr:MAG: hypothetical protein Ct9H300mP15_25200 [Gemmatimonadota bacterium]
MFDLRGFLRVSRSNGSDWFVIGVSAQVPESELQLIQVALEQEAGDQVQRQKTAGSAQLVRNALAEKLGIAKGTLLSNAVLSRVAKATQKISIA